MKTDEENDSRIAGLSDVTGRLTWTLKGAAAESWLCERGLDIPFTIYASTLPDDDLSVTRTGIDEFLVESTTGDLHQVHQELAAQQNEPADFFIFERQDALFLLTGEGAHNVMTQTCGINWNEVPPDHLVMTRVAGVSCGVRLLTRDDSPCFVIRLDPTYGVYMWQELLTICQEIGSAAAG